MIISCVIPTYRQLDYIHETLTSVLEQDYPEIELIITDDASDNFDEDEIKQYVSERMKGNVVSFLIIRHEKNIGTVRNMNEALKKCTGDIIMPIASDDVFFDSHVMSRVAVRFEQEHCEIMSCSRFLCSHGMKERIRLMPHPGYYNRLNRMDTASKQFVSMALGRSFEFASGASLYYTVPYIKNSGYYDERYTLWEDGPFLARSTRNGIKVCLAYDIVSILYRDGGISTAKNKRIPTKIFCDYCNIISNEYLNYSERFTKSQLRILKGKDIIQKNYNEITLQICAKYPEAVLNNCYIKLCKGLDRLIEKLHKREQV